MKILVGIKLEDFLTVNGGIKNLQHNCGANYLQLLEIITWWIGKGIHRAWNKWSLTYFISFNGHENEMNISRKKSDAQLVKAFENKK